MAAPLWSDMDPTRRYSLKPPTRKRQFSEGRVRRQSDNAYASAAGFTKWRAKKQSRTKTPPKIKFQRYARLAVICIRLCKYSYESLEASSGHYQSVLQVSEDIGSNIDKKGLFFDPTDFKANKQQRLSHEARRLLQMRPVDRVDKDIIFMQIALRSIRAFAEYPKRMQTKLCQVGWYEAYEPKRAILKEGHPPHSFYFILSGSVVVSSFDENDDLSRTLVTLYRGMSFGELAVITRSLRQATVHSQSTVELLCISAKDFEDIFMSGGLGNLNDPDHHVFITNIGFLKHWPVKLLLENPQECMFHYFNRGQVLVRDSNNSNWLYIVKSGSLSVMKKLRSVSPTFENKDDDTDPAMMSRDNSNDLDRSSWDYRKGPRRRKRRHRSLYSTSEPETFSSQLDLENRLEQTLPGYHTLTERLGCIDYDAVVREHRTKLITKSPEHTRLPNLVSNDDYTAHEYDVRDSPLRLPQISKTSKGVYLSSNTKKKKSKREKREELSKFKRELDATRLEREGRKTMADELDNNPARDHCITEADLHPMFIVVKVLERGQYFGVSNLIYHDQPTLSLVSNGAEVVVISKKFFMAHASQTVVGYLRRTECPFPPDEEMQQNLQEYVNWEFHRSKLYKQLVRQKQITYDKKRQYIPQSLGQYSFRTGPI